jgi:nitroreductase
MPAAGKIPAMLATSHALILATWLPSSATTDRSGEMSQVDTEYFDPSLVNVEHIAAASAAVQSLLLAATAAGIESYWSSGGVLRQPELFSQLSIPGNQRLLGAVFLFPPQLPSGVPGELATSKLRLQRGPITAWTRFVQLD